MNTPEITHDHNAVIINNRLFVDIDRVIAFLRADEGDLYWAIKAAEQLDDDGIANMAAGMEKIVTNLEDMALIMRDDLNAL